MGAKGIAALLGTVTLLALAPTAQGAAGLPDPSFGVGGFTRLDVPLGGIEQLRDVVIQADGKIVGGGVSDEPDGFLLARVNPDGSPDAGFGSNGIRVEPDTEIKGAPRSISSLAQRPDGKIVAAGLGRGDSNAFMFARYLTDGSLDAEFGAGGLRMVEISPSGFATAVALAPDQKVVGAGGSSDGKAIIVRLTENGNPDAAFNVLPVGIRAVDVPGTAGDQAEAVAVLADGTILIGGRASGKGAFLAELDANGAPVAGFGEAGIAVHDLAAGGPPSGEILDLQVLGDGRILAVGEAGANPNTEVVVVRFTPDGDLDPSFGAGGIFRRNSTAMEDAGLAIEVLPDGRIVVAGSRNEGKPGTGEVLILRLTADGRLDSTFGAGGETAANAGLGIDRAQGLEIQPDGKPVIAGFADEPGTRMLMFGRFTADDPSPPPPPPPPSPRCRGRDATLVGTNDEDRLTGTPARDVVLALAGDDKIDTFGGNDLICAGAGIDIVRAGKGRDIADGGAGRDLLFGGPGNDRLFGGPALDLVFGGGGKDLLVGGAGRRDLCNGGAGRRDRARRSCERRKRVP